MSTPTTLRQLTITQYSVLHETDSESLEIAVVKQLREGWKLQGGVSIALIEAPPLPHGTLVYAQAMTLATFEPAN